MGSTLAAQRLLKIPAGPGPRSCDGVADEPDEPVPDDASRAAATAPTSLQQRNRPRVQRQGRASGEDERAIARGADQGIWRSARAAAPAIPGSAPVASQRNGLELHQHRAGELVAHHAPEELKTPDVGLGEIDEDCLVRTQCLSDIDPRGAEGGPGGSGDGGGEEDGGGPGHDPGGGCLNLLEIAACQPLEPESAQ